MLERIKKPLWLKLGLVSFVLAIIGVALPLLPTTPFLILAAFCFSQSSEKAHDWLMQHRTFGPMIKDWQNHGRIKRKVKVVSVAMMAVMPPLSGFLGAPMWAIVAQIIVLCFVAAFILTRPE